MFARSPGPSFTRRRFVQSAVLAFAACAAPFRTAWARLYQVRWAGQPGDKPFFTARERSFIDAAVERLIPTDGLGPGAREAGVTRYIDQQLAGEYGRASRWYMEGPFRAGTPSQGYQLPYTPAQLFRASIAEVDRYVRNESNGKRFAGLPPEQQDELLTRLQKGEVELPNSDAASFFAALHELAFEGYFADPLYGGNRGKAGWKVVGFPGARGAYVGVIDQYNQPFTEPPLSIAEMGGGHGHGRK